MSLADPWWPLIFEGSWEAEEIGYGLADFLSKPEPWKAHAACRGQDPDLFFPKQGQHTAKGRMICLACVVKAQCDEYAARTGSEGVWAGELRTPKVRAVQDARPVRVQLPERTGQDAPVSLDQFRTIAARRSETTDPG